MKIYPSQTYLLGMMKVLSKIMVRLFLGKSMQLVSVGNPQPKELGK
jgi:hypothetical protein